MTKRRAYQVAVVGAGPYGLAVAARLIAGGADTVVFGEPMGFWADQMPAGMLLRSPRSASHIGDRRGVLRLESYEAKQQVDVGSPIPRDAFIAYGRWFADQAIGDLDRRRVARVWPLDGAFRLDLDDGDSTVAKRVIVAAGISRFAWRPAVFEAVPAALASHTSDHADLMEFAGRDIAVVGGGQSALELAALLSEAGARVEVIARASRIIWLDRRASWLKSHRNPARALMYPPSDVGPPGLSLIVAIPDLFRRLPLPLQKRIAHRAIRPAGAGWLVARMQGVPVTSGRTVDVVQVAKERLRLRLSDGTERSVDHALLATGYHVDVARYSFLGPELLARLRVEDGYPVLGAGFESSIPGLHFLGAPAAHSYGPLCRFVAGTAYTAHTVARQLLGRRTGSNAPPDAGDRAAPW